MSYSTKARRSTEDLEKRRMPSARTHDIITVVSGIVLTPLAYYAVRTYTDLTPATALAGSLYLGGAHIVSGVLFSPDLDIDSTIDNRWGVFFWIWRPYMWLIPHRSFWSHSLLIAPLLRLGYFALVVSALAWVVVWLGSLIGLTTADDHRALVSGVREFIVTHPLETWAVVLGFCTGSAAHTVADWLVTKGSRLLGSYGRQLRRRYRHHDR